MGESVKVRRKRSPSTRRPRATPRTQPSKAVRVDRPAGGGRAPGRIFDGTASWTDPGFLADWYPKRLPADRRLAWYAEHFRLVEVNSTFYAVPPAARVQNWCDQ